MRGLPTAVYERLSTLKPCMQAFRGLLRNLDFLAGCLAVES